MEQCEKHFFEELFGVRYLLLGFVREEGISDVLFVYVLGVKLGGNSFNAASVGARKSGYRSPPFIGCLRVDEGDEVSVRHIILALFYRRALG